MCLEKCQYLLLLELNTQNGSHFVPSCAETSLKTSAEDFRLGWERWASRVIDNIIEFRQNFHPAGSKSIS